MNTNRKKPAGNGAAVVLPLDGSRTAVRAFGAARAVTRMLGARLHVIYVSEKPVPAAELPRLLHIEAGGSRIRFHQISGETVSAIIRFAVGVDASMIVMSSHGRTHNTRQMAGGVAMRLIQHTDIPVMVIRPRKQGLPGPDWRPRRMLVPHDGSPVTAGEVEQIFNLACAMEVDIDVLHVGMIGARPPVGVGAMDGPRYLDRPHYDWPGWADEFLRRFAARPGESKVRLIYQPGEIVDAALDYAAQNRDDVIALIWHGMLGGKRAASVKGILMNAEVPVLLKRIRGGT